MTIPRPERLICHLQYKACDGDCVSTQSLAFAQLNEGYKFKMDLTTNGVVITDAIKFVQTNKEKLTMSSKEDDKESKEPDYDEV